LTVHGWLPALEGAIILAIISFIVSRLLVSARV
jgi:hypothetical protein